MFFLFLGKSWGKWMEDAWKMDGSKWNNHLLETCFFLVGKCWEDDAFEDCNLE